MAHRQRPACGADHGLCADRRDSCHVAFRAGERGGLEAARGRRPSGGGARGGAFGPELCGGKLYRERAPWRARRRAVDRLPDRLLSGLGRHPFVGRGGGAARRRVLAAPDADHRGDAACCPVHRPARQRLPAPQHLELLGERGRRRAYPLRRRLDDARAAGGRRDESRYPAIPVTASLPPSSCCSSPFRSPRRPSSPSRT